MKEYQFYGYEYLKNIKAITEEYPGIQTPTDLYDALCEAWCVDTCAPRLREKWNENNKTLGQCSITAFLAQDIFGGKVYGILRPGGNYHCYNVVDGICFDLTSEQFGEETLCYDDNSEQFRDVHFSKEEKRLRYEMLKERLKKRQSQYQVVRIEEDLDFGCEERMEGSPVMAVVVLRDRDGKERKIRQEDQMLYDSGINEGSWVWLDSGSQKLIACKAGNEMLE